MIIAGHQPNYLPYLGFFHKITLVDTFVIVDTVQYVKRGTFGWMNRNKIRTVDGAQWLTVPILSKGLYTQKINETQIDNSKDWARKHWRSIETAYAKAPFFTQYRPFFEKLYTKEWTCLADLSEAIIRYSIEQLGIKVNITKTSVIGAEGKATDLIIDMCKKLGADTYAHGQHGKDYLDTAKFEAAGIKCLWQEFRHPVYKQVYQPFMPDMSIIDLLFNHGPASLDILCGKFRSL